MFDVIVTIPIHGEKRDINPGNMASFGFVSAKEFDERSEDFQRGSIVDILCEVGQDSYEVRRVVLGNITADVWDTPPTLYLRWPDAFRDESMTAIGIKIVEPAKSVKEAVDDVMNTINIFANLNAEQMDIIAAKLASIAALSAVETVDWDSSSLYC